MVFFRRAHCRLSRLAADSRSSREGLFFLLSLLLFSISPPLSYKSLMHGLTQTRVDSTVPHVGSRLLAGTWKERREGGGRRKSALAHIHSEEIYCHLAQIQSGRSRKQKVYGCWGRCHDPGTFRFTQTDVFTVNSPDGGDCVSQSLFVHFKWRKWLISLHENGIAEIPQHSGYLNILQGAFPHSPGEVRSSWSSLFHSLNYLLGGRRRTFRLQGGVRLCLS